MAHVRPRKRKDGTSTFNVRYDLDGRESSVTWPDLKSAQDFCHMVNSVGARRAMEIFDVAENTHAQPTGMTVAQWLDHHITHLSGVERKTISEYRRYAQRDINVTLGDIPLAQLTEADVARWVNAMSAAGSSGSTISHKHAFLSGAMKIAVKLGHVPHNPCMGMRLPRTPKKEMVFLTREEFRLLHSCFTPFYQPLVEFLVASGLRFSEAAALTPADVDLTHHTVRISKAWKAVPGVGIELGAPKTERSIRTIDVPERVLRNLRMDRQWLFMNSRGRPVRVYTWRKSIWYPALERAHKKGLTKKPRVHDLRHTCASWMVQAGVPLPVVRDQLGHDSIKTTVDLYSHLDRASRRAGADAIAAALSL